MYYILYTYYILANGKDQVVPSDHGPERRQKVVPSDAAVPNVAVPSDPVPSDVAPSSNVTPVRMLKDPPRTNKINFIGKCQNLNL